MSNYTGPVLLVPFIGPKDEFKFEFDVNADDPESVEKIVARFAEDGYKPLLKDVVKAYKVNGTIVPREATAWPRLDFATRSAFIRG